MSSSRILGGLLFAAAAVATLPAHAETSYEAAPPGANNWSCHPSAAHPYPVVLLHGTFSNMGQNFSYLAPKLTQAGYCIYALNYGANQYSQGTGGQVNGLAPVADSATQLGVFVDRVLAATGASKVDIVGHSQGGMMPRWYMHILGGYSKVHTLVGIAPDNHGSDLNGFNNYANMLGQQAKDALVSSWAPSLTDQQVGSTFINQLNASGDTVPGPNYTVISSKNDTVATPYTAQALVGPQATNIVIQDQCSSVYSDHVSMIMNPMVARNMLNALDPAHAVPVNCNTMYQY